MTWQPTRLTRSQMAERRGAAAQLLGAKHLSQAEIARQLGVSRAAVTKWKQQMDRAGRDALRGRRASGRPPRLTEAQWDQLLGLLQRGAHAARFDTERWTLRRIARVIEQTFKVRYQEGSLSRALHARDW